MERRLPKTPDLSIVTVTYNSEPYIRGCLDSVRRGAGDLAIEFVIVDNASSDHSVEILKTEYPEVVLVENSSNRGFTAANNQGAARVRGRFVAFLNPDTLVPDGTFQTLIGAMERHPDIGVIAPRLVDEHGKLSHDMGDRRPTFWTLVNTFWLLNRLSPRVFPGVQRSTDIEGTEDCDWACGACLVVRREVADAFGWTHFGVGDDFAYCNQIREAGWRIAVTGDAEVVHFAGRSWKVAPRSTLKGPPSNYARYLREHRSPLYAALSIAAMRGGLRARSALHRILYQISKDPERLYKANKTRQFLGHDEYAVFRRNEHTTPESYPG